MTKLDLKIPKSVLSLPKDDREAIIDTLREAMKLPKVVSLPRATADEHNIWETNTESLMGAAEDDFYRELVTPWAETVAVVLDLFDLPTEGLEKSFSEAFEAYEDTLIKANDKRPKISDLINISRKKREDFIKWVADGSTLTRAQMKKLDDILKKRLPNFAKKAEEFMTRAGFIGKIRRTADEDHWSTVGALVDRYPQTIHTATHEGVVLTKRAAGKAAARGEKVKILPLTPREVTSVKHAAHHAASKVTEIADRHRNQVKQMVIQARRERWGAQKLAQALFDKFGDQNRDWRRVAITELSFAANDAFLTECDEGDRVIGMGAVDACKYCKEYVIGKEFNVTHGPPKNTYDHEMNYVWAGKSNYGRTVASYVPCIPLHPNCRCRWHKLSRFYTMKDGKAVRKTTAQLIQEERAKRGLAPDPDIEAKLAKIQGAGK